MCRHDLAAVTPAPGSEDDQTAILPYQRSMTEPAHAPRHDKVLIVDFGSQVTQLIARRLREAGVYCEIQPFQSVDQATLKQFDPKAIVLSGGPASVIEGAAPAADPAIFAAKVPVLGICYGDQTMAQ